MLSLQGMAGTNLLEIPDVETSPGLTVKVPVMLRNQDPVTAIELSIRCDNNGWWPAMTEIETTDRLTPTHETGFSINSGIFKLLIFSSDNAPINASDGIVCYIPVCVDSSAEENVPYPIEIVDCLLVRPDGENIASGYASGNLIIRQTPDLTPGNLSIAESSVEPGGMITAGWTVSNVGSCASFSGFRETVELVDSFGRFCYLGECHYDKPIPAGASVDRKEKFSIHNIPGMDGDLHLRVTIYPYSDCGESISNRDNNVALSSSTVNMPSRLQLYLPYEMTEGDPLQSVTLIRSGRTDSPLTVSLSHKPSDSRLSIPAEVVFDTNSAYATFNIELRADDSYQPDTDISIIASAPGFADTSAAMLAHDVAEPEFTLTEESEELTEGGSMTFTLSRNVRAISDIEVKIDCEKSSLFRFPSSITFPAGETATTFDVEAVDNNSISVPRSIMFQASAPDYKSGRTYITLLDDDMPDISLSLSPSTVAENAGASGVVATVRRLSGSSGAIRVKLSSDMPEAIFHDSEIILPAGTMEATLPIGIVDNALADGDRTVNMAAAIYSSECGCWAGDQQRGYVKASFTITDNDGPALTLTSPASMREGGKASVTVSRNSSTSEAMTVAISSEADGDINASVPGSVTIPAGASSADFEIEVPANDREGDSATLALYARADGFSAGSCRIYVTDATLPDAVIRNIEISATECAPEDMVDVSVIVANEETIPLPAHTPVMIYDGDNLLSTAYSVGSIAPGASETVVKSVKMPTHTGETVIKARVNADKKIGEILYYNNDSKPVNINISANVAATLEFDRARYPQGETVKFSGKIIHGIRPGGVADVYFINNGVRSIVHVQIADDGSFSGTFRPYRYDAGKFKAGVDYNGDRSTEPIASFDAMALYTGVRFGTVNADEGEAFTYQLPVTNLCSFPLTGVTAEGVASVPGEIESIEIPSEIGIGKTAMLTVRSAVLSPTPGKDWNTLHLTVTSTEGASIDHILYYYAHSLRGSLHLSDSEVSTTMTKGSERLYTVTLTNDAKGETGDIEISVPRSGWLTLASPSNIPSLREGESVDISFRLSPTADMQLNNPVSAVVAVNATNADGATISIKAEPVSETTGTLLIEACDEYTYTTAEAPHVTGATVSVMHPATRKVLHTLTTDADGLASIEIPEGYYYVSVTEPNHSGFEGMLLVDPAKTTRKTVNLGIQGVSVDMRYEQTEIEDIYDIVTTVKYETNVPIPVVETILPDRLDFDAIQPGEAIVYNTVLTNKGLITAANTSVILPEYDDPEYTVEVIGDNGFDLLPGESRVVPVRVSRMESSAQDSPAVAARSPRSKSSCHMTSITLYESYCGPDKKIHSIPFEIQVKVCSGVNPGPVSTVPSSGGGYWWGGIYGPGSPSGVTTVNPGKTENPAWVDKFESWVCDPCTNNFMNAGAECMGFDPKHPIQSLIKKIPVIGDIAGCGFGIKNCYDENEGRFWQNCGGELFSCAMTACEQIGGYLVKAGMATAATGAGAPEGAIIAGTGAVLEATCKVLGEGKDLLDCADKLHNACPKKKNDRNGARAMTLADEEEEAPDYDAMYPSYLAQYAEKLDHVIDGRKAIHSYFEEIIGIESFLDATSAELFELFDAMAAVPDGDLLDADELLQFAPESVSEDEFRAFITRQNNSSLKQQGMPYEGDAIDFDLLKSYADRINATNAYAESLGYEDVATMINDAYITMQEGYNDKSGSVCSSVTLAIEQRMTMTRQAIRGTLTVVNGHESAELSDFKTWLTVYDADGELVGSDRLQIAVEDLDGFSGDSRLDAGWKLAHGTEGVATVLFIPTKKAAPEGETLYTFTGEVSYLDPFSGLEVTRPLTPATLAIYPSPELYLTYFMQRDVLADDPLTPNVCESSEPAEFALVVANRGKGDARNVSLTTSQPRIVDNEKGLALEMRIVESRLNGAQSPMVPDEKIVNNFGDIPAGSASYAQWMIESNLLGHFTDYDVDVTHVSSYDNPDLSLLDGAEIHELIQGMTLPSGSVEETSAVRAFVVNDRRDALDSPDRIFFSDDRADLPVFDDVAAEVIVNGLSGTLSISPRTSGWQYFSIPDPTYGMMELSEIVRESDGIVIPADNFRQTDRTLRDGHDPVYEYMLRGCLYAEAGETYRLTFVEREDTPVRVSAWTGIPDEGTVASAPVTEIGVTFNSPVDPTSVMTANMKLLCQGKPVTLDNVTVTPTDDPASFTIGFGELTQADGYYQLSLNLESILDTEGRHGSGWARCGWVMLADGNAHISVSVKPAGAGTISEFEDSVEPGTSVTLAATPADGFTFQAWMRGDEILSREPELQFTAESDISLTALFANVCHQVDVAISDPMAGNITGASTGIYPHGAEITLRAEPEAGWNFTAWILIDDLDRETILSEEMEYSLTVESDMNIIARFGKERPATPAIHDICLAEGYNWISFPVESPLNNDLPSLLSGILPDFAAIYSGSAGLRYTDGEWSGDLNSVVPQSGYRLMMNNPGTLRIEGTSLPESCLTMTLDAGTSMIGTPLRKATDINEALAGLAAGEGDVILGHDRFAIYNGAEWIGSLSRLSPGEAYLINLAERSTFNWPDQQADASKTDAVTGRTLGELKVNPADHPHSMAIVIKLESDMNTDLDNYLIAAFDSTDGECIGISEAHDGLHFLVAHGENDAGQSFIYKAVDSTTGRMIDLTSTEATPFREGTLGTTAQPILLTIGDNTGIEGINDRIAVYPNPVKESLHITGIEDPEARISIIDHDGRLHMRHNGLESHTILDLSDMAGGIYRVIIRTSAGSTVLPLIKE